MHAVSVCPRCQKPVLLPARAAATTQVRCPLCNAEYALDEAIPPELIPIGGIPANEPPAELSVHSSAEPSVSEIYGLCEDDETVVVPTRKLADAAAGIFNVSVPRRRSQRFVSGTILSGLIGCLMAYYGLALLFGPRFKAIGFPELPLPFISGLVNPADKADPPPRNFPPTTPRNFPPAPPGAKKSPLAIDPQSRNGAEADASHGAPADRARARPSRPAPVAEKSGPKAGPSVTRDELEAALKNVSASAAGKHDNPMPPKLYDAFCQLGTRITFVAGSPSNKDPVERTDAVRSELQKIATSPKQVEEIAKKAGEHLDAKPQQNSGILLAGTVKGLDPQDRLWNTRVEMPGQSKTVNVISREKPGIGGEKVLVLGVIVRDPGTNLVGYHGKEPVVVWAAVWVRVP